MALKPTIYKVELDLVDTDRHVYENLKLTMALHPSENFERMMVRLLAYGINYHRDLEFTRGLSATEEADIWQQSPDGSIEHWIEVGQASPDRIRKAVSRAPLISLYAYGSEVDVWWPKHQEAFAGLPKVKVWKLDWAQVQQLNAFESRTMVMSLSISDGELYLSSDTAQLSLSVESLQ